MTKISKPSKISEKKVSKKALLESVEKNLEAVLSNIDADLGKKKMKKKIQQAGKILVKGMKVKKNKAKETTKEVEQ